MKRPPGLSRRRLSLRWWRWRSALAPISSSHLGCCANFQIGSATYWRPVSLRVRSAWRRQRFSGSCVRGRRRQPGDRPNIWSQGEYTRIRAIRSTWALRSCCSASPRSRPRLIATTVLFAIVVHFGVVRREEAYLEAKFGEEYRDYMRRTPRYSPRIRTSRSRK